METQFTDYGEWTRETVLPQARDTARLPEELYALNLRDVGIDMDPREAMSQARRGFYEIRAQMEALAPQIAEKNGWPETDMAGVMARLKQQTIPNDEIEEFYRGVNRELEAKAEVVKLTPLRSRCSQMDPASL